MANRVLIGNRTGGQTTGYGAFVSKTGANVLTCNDTDLIFNSRLTDGTSGIFDQNGMAFDVYASGSVSISAAAGLGSRNTGITWLASDFKYGNYQGIPMILLSCEETFGSSSVYWIDYFRYSTGGSFNGCLPLYLAKGLNSSGATTSGGTYGGIKVIGSINQTIFYTILRTALR